MQNTGLGVPPLSRETLALRICSFFSLYILELHTIEIEIFVC